MSVYFITLISVCALCYLAEEYDWPEIDEYDRLRVLHSPDAQKLYFVAACILICVAGFRYRVGTDYMAYYRGYVDYLDNLPNAIRNLNEPGYGVLAWIATRFYNDGAAPIFFASLVTVSLPLLVIYRHSKELLLPTFLFMTMGCWTGAFNGVRQYLAASILFCGYKSLRERSIINYCLIVFVAFLFHRSAIVFIVLYFIVDREINIPNIIILIITTGLLLYSYDRVFQFANFVMDQEYSLEIEYTSRAVNRLRILATFVPVIIFGFEYLNQKRTQLITFSLNILIFRAALSVLAMNSALLYRINIYMSFFAPLAISELLKGVHEKNRRVVMYGLVGMHLVMWLYEVYISSSLNQFQWIWER